MTISTTLPGEAKTMPVQPTAVVVDEKEKVDKQQLSVMRDSKQIHVGRSSKSPDMVLVCEDIKSQCLEVRTPQKRTHIEVKIFKLL